MIFQADGADVWAQIWMVVKMLGPIWALAFGLVGLRYLVDLSAKALNLRLVKWGVIKPPPPKKRRPPRPRVFVSHDLNPTVRRTKRGIYVYYERKA